MFAHDLDFASITPKTIVAIRLRVPITALATCARSDLFSVVVNFGGAPV